MLRLLQFPIFSNYLSLCLLIAKFGGAFCRWLNVTSWWFLIFQIPRQTLCVFFMDSDFIQSNSWLWYYKIHYLSHNFCFLLEPLKPRIWLMPLGLYKMGTILSWRKCKCLHLLYLLVLSLKLFCYFIYLRGFFLVYFHIHWRHLSRL